MKVRDQVRNKGQCFKPFSTRSTAVLERAFVAAYRFSDASGVWAMPLHSGAACDRDVDEVEVAGVSVATRAAQNAIRPSGSTGDAFDVAAARVRALCGDEPINFCPGCGRQPLIGTVGDKLMGVAAPSEGGSSAKSRSRQDDDKADNSRSPIPPAQHVALDWFDIGCLGQPAELLLRDASDYS